MEHAVLGLVLDSSVLIAADREKLTTPEAVKSVRFAGVRMKPSSRRDGAKTLASGPVVHTF
jgi:hypothetical protein